MKVPFIFLKALLLVLCQMVSSIGLAQGDDRDGCYYPPELSLQVRTGTLVHYTMPLANGSSTTIVLEPGMHVSFNVYGGGLMCWAALAVRLDGVLMDSCTWLQCNTTYIQAGTYQLTGRAQGVRTAEVIILHDTISTVTSQLSLMAILAGAFNAEDGRMRSDLSANGQLPIIEPYTDEGYHHPSCGGEMMDPSVVETWQADPIVDWVRVELLRASTHEVAFAVNAVIHASGKVRTHNGNASLAFHAPFVSYQLVLRHRNHLSAWSRPITYPFTISTLHMHESNSYWMETSMDTRMSIDGIKALRCGNAVSDTPTQRISYTGSNNDRDAILQRIGGTNPTATVSGYFNEDVNLDGVVKYTGVDNDRDIILQAIGGVNPIVVVNE